VTATAHVICTAGHVDHGKSALVTALTGMQPDRFAEEQRRGLTIDLGFAWTQLDDEHTIAFVDLPGHERFIGNMLAGAGPVEIALLVVAANEGWMPQSGEHLAILDLLGVRHGVVALTKTDLVDTDTVELAELEVREELEGTSLAGAQVVATSARADQGLGALRAALGSVCAAAGTASDRGRPRVWIDRAFTIRGAGTVVTGTLAGGGLAVGDDLTVLPAGGQARARGLQSLGRDSARVGPGSRVAVNVAGVERSAVARGHALVRAGQWRASAAFDAWVRVLPGHRLTHTGAWHAHVGSGAHVATVYPLGAPRIDAGGQGAVRIELRTPTVVEAGDRVVLREVGRGVTVGGGPVLDPQPPPRPRGRVAREARTRQLALRRDALDDRARLLALHVAERGAIPRGDAEAAVGLHPHDPPDGVRSLAEHYVDQRALDGWTAALVAAVAHHHATHPLQRSMARPAAARAVAAAGCPTTVVDAAIDHMVAAGAIVREESGLRAPGHEVQLDAAQRTARDRLVAVLRAEPYAPPPLSTAAAQAGATAGLVAQMETAGHIVRLSGDLAMAGSAVDEATALLRDAAGREGALTASRARQILGTSRKYTLPLLEELDRRGITRRIGDTREFR
jgi:selenocysteine-specific elongation factor